jgi:hypothetical protein
VDLSEQALVWPGVAKRSATGKWFSPFDLETYLVSGHEYPPPGASWTLNANSILGMTRHGDSKIERLYLTITPVSIVTSLTMLT